MKSETVIARYLSFFAVLFLLLNQNALGQSARPEMITFRSGDLELKGYLWKPSGDGPFPAVLWNHGSAKTVGAIDGVEEQVEIQVALRVERLVITDEHLVIQHRGE